MRSFSRVLAGLCVVLFGLGWIAAPSSAAADDWVVGAEPGIRQVTKLPPGRVTVAFTREIFQSDPRLYVLDTAGDQVSIGAVTVEGTNLSVQLASDLPKGTYTVEFRVQFSQDDVRGGTFQFAYGTSNWTKKTSWWVGEDDEPDIYKGENPDRPKASDEPVATPSDEPSETPTPSVTPTASPTIATPSPSATPTTTPATPGSTATGLWLGLGALAVAAAGGTGLFVWLRRRRP